MKKIVFTITTVLIMCGVGFAQKEKTKKYKEIFYKDIALESDDVNYSTNNGWSNKELTKFKLKLTNKTGDILLYKPEESVFKVGGKEFKPKEKNLFVYPGQSDFRIVNYNSPEFLVTSYSYLVSGVYKISINGDTQAAEDFKLPASKNDFKAGNFNCTLTSLTKETDKTQAKFECTYTGSKIGVINPGKAAVKLPDGTEIANEKKSSDPMVLTKGQSEKVSFKWNRMEGGRATDMQKVDLLILFRETFTETEAVKAKEETLNFEIDENVTK